MAAIPGYCPITCDSNDGQTVASGFNKRLLRQVPTADHNILGRFKDFVSWYCKTHIKRITLPDFEEWLAHTNYNEQRKNQLRDARDKLRGGPPTPRQASHVDSFVKTESYPVIKYARMINSRCDAFKAYSGPWFHAIEEELYQQPEFVKHMTPAQRLKAVEDMDLPGRNYYSTDFTAFESHFVPEVMNACELVLYKHCLQDFPQVSEVICRTISGTNKMRTRSGVRAKCQARRMSGDMCTSLGNGFTNLMLFKFLCHEHHQRGGGLVEGDDGLFWTSGELKQEWYESLGFTIKIVPVSDPRVASFCGVVYGDNALRDPRKVFQTFGWTHSCISAGPKIMRELQKAKALSMRYECPHCPIIGELARVVLNNTPGGFRFVEDGYHRAPDGQVTNDFNPTAKDRDTFARLFGITSEVQMIAEQAIRDLNFAMLAKLIPPTYQQSWFCERYVEVT